jgi:hypothetical protein
MGKKRKRKGKQEAVDGRERTDAGGRSTLVPVL